MSDSGATGIRLFDAHAYLGRFPSLEVGNGTADELIADMDRLGIERALVTHTSSKLYDPAFGNELIGNVIANQPRLVGCWAILPQNCGELPRPGDLVTRAFDRRIVAFRAFPATHGYELDDPGMRGILASVAAAGLPVMVDADETTWRTVDRVAGDQPQLSLVISLVGYRQLRAVADLLDRRSNVNFDLSNLATHRGLEWLVQRFGPSRLIFGTGAPLRDGAEAVARLLWSDLEDESIRAIGSENLIRLTGSVA